MWAKSVFLLGTVIACLCRYTQANLFGVYGMSLECQIGSVCKIGWTTDNCQSKANWTLKIVESKWFGDIFNDFLYWGIAGYRFCSSNDNWTIIDNVVESAGSYAWSDTSWLTDDKQYCLCMEKHNSPGIFVLNNCQLHAVENLSGDAEQISDLSCSSSSLPVAPVAGIGVGCAAGSAFITLAAFALLRRRSNRKRFQNQLAEPVQPGPAPPYVHQHPELAGSKDHSTPYFGRTWTQHPGTPISLPSHITEPHRPVPSTLELPATPIESSNDIWQGPGKAEVPTAGNSGPPSDLDLGVIREDTISPIRHLSPTPAPRRARSREPEFEMVTKQSMSSIRDEVSQEKGN